ncbi:MAG: PhnD/SsuA/transferrin family substrate-binding protein, partial [Pseudomonadota bacterium]
GQWAAGGFVFQTALLSNMGFDPRTEAASFEIASDQTVLIEDLLANKYDAVFVRTGVVESFVETGYLDPDAIAIFNEQQDDVFPYVRSTILYPEWFLVSQATTDPQLITAVQSAAFALPPDAAAAVDAQILGFGPPLDVTGVIEAMRAAAVPPYD